jgi:hypothetical protein
MISYNFQLFIFYANSGGAKIEDIEIIGALPA